MEIAENITWTEELERLDVLLSQGQFELLLPGERYGGGEKEIWLVYLMNDAAESFLVFHDAELTGTYQKEYEGEIDAALEKDGEQYVLIVRQKETVCTLFFSRLSLEVHLFDYGKTGHFWVDGYEYLRQIEFRIAILRDKLEYLGEAFCTEEEMRLASLANFPPLNFCCYPAVPDQYLVPSCPWWEATEEAITEMKNWHRRQAIKCCCGILHFMKMAGKTPRKTDRKTAAYEPPRESRGFTGKKLAREAQNYPKRRFTGEEGTQIRKIQEQAMKRKRYWKPKENAHHCCARSHSFMHGIRWNIRSI